MTPTDALRLLAWCDQEIAKFEELADQPFLDDNEIGRLNFFLVSQRQLLEQLEEFLAKPKP